MWFRFNTYVRVNQNNETKICAFLSQHYYRQTKKACPGQSISTDHCMTSAVATSQEILQSTPIAIDLATILSSVFQDTAARTQ